MTAEQAYEEATLKELGKNPQGTRQDIIYAAMEIYAESRIQKAIGWLQNEKFDVPRTDFEKTYNSTLHKAINYLQSLK